MKIFSILVFLVMIILCRTADAQSSDNYPSQFLEWFRKIDHINVNRLNKYIVKPEQRERNKKYSNGYEVLNDYIADQRQMKQIILALLARETYSIEEVIASCYFIPDVSIELYTAEGRVRIILLSLSCRKLLIRDERDLKNKDAKFFELSGEGFFNINNIIKNGFSILFDFDNFKNDTTKLLPALASDIEIGYQLRLTEELVKQKDISTLKKFKDTGVLTLIDSLSEYNGKLKRLELIFHEGITGKEKTTFDSLIAKGQLPDLAQLSDKKVLEIPEQPSSAEIVDRLALSTEADDAKFYLNRIDQLIAHYKILQRKYSIEEYLAYEKEKKIITNAQQVACRKTFIQYLRSRL